MSGQRGTALAEFAAVWPVLLLAALGAIELALWSAEASAARASALAGARAGAAAGAGAPVAQGVTLAALSPFLAGVRPAAWCPGAATAAPPVWVCAQDAGPAIRVQVGGGVPALVPLLPGRGLPLHADARVAKEVFT